MKNLIILFGTAILLLASCGSPKGLTEVKSPFSGSSYEGNRRFFRATASGESTDLETSKSKAMLSAKQKLASFVQTQIKQVAENYSGERQAGDNIAEFNARFQQLTREVLNQVLVEINVIGDKTYKNGKGNYESYVALEARKKAVYKRLKEVSMQNKSLSEKDKELVQQMIDKAIQDCDDGN
jgi:cell division protein FtsB